MAGTYCLRAASADRLDLFEAEFVMTADGVPEVRGGNVRRLDGTRHYLPHEVWLIKPHGYEPVRDFIRSIEQAMRELPRKDDIAFARARDALGTHLTANLQALLKVHARPVTPADFT